MRQACIVYIDGHTRHRYPEKMYDTSEADIDVLLTGYQWRWRYGYIEEDVSFFSNLRTH